MAGDVKSLQNISFSSNEMFWKRKSCDIQSGLERRNFVLKATRGSPKLKDALRQRLKEHVKLRRDGYVNKLRQLSEENVTDRHNSCLGERMSSDIAFACPIDEGVVGEASTLNDESEFSTMEEIEKEELTRAELLLLQQYEEFFREDEAVLDSLLAAIYSEGVLCPLCSRSTLVARQGQPLIDCPACRETLHWPGSLDDLSRALCQRVDAHHRSCRHPAGFAVVPEGDRRSLVIACTECNFFNLV